MKESNDTPYCSLKEAATRSGLSEYIWRQYVRQGKIPYINSGVKYYVNYPASLDIINQFSNSMIGEK